MGSLGSSDSGSSGSSDGSGNASGIENGLDSSVEKLRPEIVAEHPWDTSTFTQGLEVAGDDQLVVGTGMYGDSRIYRTTLDGQQSDSYDLEDQYFGEGITVHGDKVWQLTWKKGVAYHRNLSDLAEIGTATYEGEGWGICSQGQRLVMSDGTDKLTFRDPETFQEAGSVSVTIDGQKTTYLNELDCSEDGTVYANVWQTDQIFRIDPGSGKVTGVIDTAGEFPAKNKPGADVLNGIAHIPGTDRYLVTGKYWDTLYEVRFVPSVS